MNVPPENEIGELFREKLAAFTEKVFKAKDNAVKDALAYGCPQCGLKVSADRDDLRILDIPPKSQNTRNPGKIEIRFLVGCKECLSDEKFPMVIDFFSMP